MMSVNIKAYPMSSSDKQTKISLGPFILCLILIIIASILALILMLRAWQGEKVPQGKTTLSFTQVDLPFENKIDLENSLPFLASAALDIDGDGIDELFLGGGDEQNDVFFKFDGTRFVPLQISLEKHPVDATHGAAHIDFDEDGDVDLFTARESGIWYHENQGGVFSSRKLSLKLGGAGDDANNTTPLSIGLGDINKDGLADLYIAGYLKIDRVEGETIFADGYGGFSHLFLNMGGGEFKDISKEWGVWRQHNSFIGTFADMNRDGFSDLIVAQDTGKVETYINNKGTGFLPQPNPSDYSYPMGIAIGDYDNDGWMDGFFSNVGYTLPPFILRGDLPKDAKFNHNHMLFHNQNGVSYDDTAKAAKVNRYGFGWGAIFTDIDLDSYEDILMSQNYARMPMQAIMTRYNGKILLGDGRSFTPVEKTSGGVNPHFGIAPLVADFNGDGRPDLVWANVAGPSLAYISEPSQNNYITLNFPDVAASLNAEIMLTLPDWTHRYKQVIAGQGLGSDGTRKITFGLGPFDKAERIVIKFQNGNQTGFSNVPANKTLPIEIPIAPASSP